MRSELAASERRAADEWRRWWKRNIVGIEARAPFRSRLPPCVRRDPRRHPSPPEISKQPRSQSAAGPTPATYTSFPSAGLSPPTTHCAPAPPQAMADMPSNPRPPSRPSPPVHDRRRSGRGIPTPRTPTSPTAQRGSPTTGTPNGNGGLRPPFSPQRPPQRQHRPGHRSSAGRHGNFAAGREEFNFTDSELSDDDDDSEENGHARRSRRDDDEVWIDPGDDDEDVDYYGILNVSRNVREPSSSFASGIGRVNGSGMESGGGSSGRIPQPWMAFG